MLPGARELAQVPNDLELTLTKGINLNDFKQDPQLRALAQEARKADNNYVLTAILPHSTNRGTANQLVSVQNTLYASALQDRLHKGDGKAIGGTVYRSGRGYSSME